MAAIVAISQVNSSGLALKLRGGSVVFCRLAQSVAKSNIRDRAYREKNITSASKGRS